MSKLLTSVAMAAALAVTTTAANAAVILTFGQAIQGSTITAVENGSDTATTITGTNVPVTITQILGGGPVVNPAIFNLTATSTGPAGGLGIVTQPYSGSFSITSGANGTGVNYLSGTFADLLFGGGTSLTLSVSDAVPGENVTFTSSVIPASALGDPRAVSLSFADVMPGVTVLGSSIAGFNASVSGTFSAAIPEPATLALLGFGLLGLGLARHNR